MNQPPDANFLLQLFLAATFIGNCIAIWLSVANRRTMQKREVSFTVEPASKEEFVSHCERNAKEHDQMFAKIGGVERGIGNKVEDLNSEWHRLVEGKFTAMLSLDHQSREKMHQRINSVEEKVAGTRAAVELQTQHLARMDAKLDRLAERKIS